MFATSRNYDTVSLAHKLNNPRSRAREPQTVVRGPTTTDVPPSDLFPSSESRPRPTPSNAGDCMPRPRPNTVALQFEDARGWNREGSTEARQKRPCKDGVGDATVISANTSAKRRTEQRQKTSMSARKRHKGSSETAPERTCCLCDGDLETVARHQCVQCPDINFCVKCSVNASTFHPGHDFTLIRPSRGRGERTETPEQGTRRHASIVPVSPEPVGPDDSESDGEQGQQRPASVDSVGLGSSGVERPGGSGDGEPGGPHTSGNIVEAAKYTIRIPQCSSCELKLFDLRYECQECIGTHFCRGCHTLHSHHVLKRFTHPLILDADSSSCASASEDEGDATLDDCPDNTITDWDVRSGDCSKDNAVIEDQVNEAGTDFDIAGGADAENGSSRSCTDDLPDGCERGEPRGEEFQEPEDRHGKRRGRRQHSDTTESMARSHDGEVLDRSGLTVLRDQSIRAVHSQSVSIPYSTLKRMTAAMARARDDIQVFVGAAEQILRSQASGASLGTPDTSKPRAIESSHMVRVPQSLLNFPMDFATLGSDLDGDDDNYTDDDVDGDGDRESFARSSRRGGGRLRQWSAAERQRLREMKQKGWADDRIGRILDRSPSAIGQQWRKQKD